MKRTIIYSILMLGLQSAQAGNRSGSVTAQFLKIPINARVAAIGNAQVSLAEGASSIAFNPAGTLSISTFSFSGTYNQWWADIQHGFVGAAVNFPGIGTIGAGVTALATDDMSVTTPGFPEGTGEMFRASEFAFTLTYARQISELFGLGLSLKYINSNLYNTDINSNVLAFDFGTLYDIPVLRTRLGISVNNLGKDLRYINETYSLPTALRFGARVNVYEEGIHRVFGVIQVGRPNDADEQWNIGGEYIYQEIFALRGGYRFNYDTEDWSAGVGVLLNSLGLNGSVDYAFTHYKFLPGTHMFTIETGF